MVGGASATTVGRSPLVVVSFRVWCQEWLPRSSTLQVISSPHRRAFTPSSIAAAHHAPPQCLAASPSVSW
jgi:hypothetical protein